jgi:hypothetical protein
MEPSESRADSVIVEAGSKREAIKKAVKHLLNDKNSWASVQRWDGANPFAGYKAERVDWECEDDEVIK